ncbi:TPA: hypothetical protein ACMEXA_005644 [Klebsiella variicola subsp. variicola]|uniref:hypothetical protein n=1 Tax=Klebsiella variicola TaxID=244366 RepID=UPI001CCCDCCB|nr:hypothetical protein [Klebsiella variicola]HBQ8857500.1 hypothetical protein [Klebsiella variicola subsp. variicola]HBQ8869341.1 hypothetical protein [Klebsiella pneumoniae]MEC5999698.1 hypothetical protein [Klebsiella variicola]UBN00574.1 hypothetical protein LB484_29365 [Klebsiella variicola]HBQ8863808.1 hypothetical protein [Klebsiella variicola subsp. variicola]
MKNRDWNRNEEKYSEKDDEECLDDSTIEVSLSSEDEDKEVKKEKFFDKDQHIENLCITAAIVVGTVGAIIYLPLFLIMMAGLTIKEFYDRVRNY